MVITVGMEAYNLTELITMQRVIVSEKLSTNHTKFGLDSIRSGQAKAVPLSDVAVTTGFDQGDRNWCNKVRLQEGSVISV